MRLFVVGNGFDLAHGLQTKYEHFSDFIEEKDWAFLDELEKPYGYGVNANRDLVKDVLWRDFESNLSRINEDEIIDGITSIDLGLEGGNMGIEDTMDDYLSLQYGYIKRLSKFLKQWVKQIDINTVKRTSMIDPVNNDKFLSFNYTRVLEDIYCIDDWDVLHIHGSLNRNDIEPVIGHGNKECIFAAQQKEEESSTMFDEMSTSAYRVIQNYYEVTLKDVS